MLIISLFLLFIAKIIIHSYAVNIYTRNSIKNIGSFKAKNAGGLVIGIFGFIFMIPIYVNIIDLSKSILYNYEHDKENKIKRLAQLARELRNSISNNIQVSHQSQNNNNAISENRKENEAIIINTRNDEN